MRKKHTYLLATVLIAISSSSLSAEVLYHIIDLGTGEAYSINNSGQIVGSTETSDPYDWGCQPVLFDRTGSGKSVYLAPNEHGYAMSINTIGQITGYTCRHYDEDERATLFDTTGEGNNIDLRTPSEWVSKAFSINNMGQVVGLTKLEELPMPPEQPSLICYATLFDPTGNGNHKNLGTPGVLWSEAYSINNKGQIVGYSDNRATLFDSTGGRNNINLGTLPGGSDSYAVSINDRGQIVGGAYDSSGKFRAMLFDSNGTGHNIDLGTLAGTDESCAYCINNAGQIVGTSYTLYSNDCRATLFDPTGGGNNINLNDVIPPTPVWKLMEARYINDSGWIVGHGKNPNGEYNAFLLIPVSENDLTLTIKVEPNDVGIDTITPSLGEHKYLKGRAVDLQTKLFKKCPDVYHFDHWEGDVVDPNSPITTVIMDKDKIITAVFIAAERICGDECHPILQGDLNRDCYVNFADFVIYADQWLACTHPDCD